MKIFIIEDEIVAAERLKDLVRQMAPHAQIVGWADSIEDSVAFLKTNPMPDLLLMDIELVDGQSFEIFGEVDVTCPVIFTTAYDEYALQAFKVHSIDYLLKPIGREELGRSLAKFEQLRRVYQPAQPLNVEALLQQLRQATATAPITHREHFLVRQGQRLISVALDEIAYFYSQDRVTFLKTHEGRYFPIDYPLEDVEQQIDTKHFFRASRQFLLHRRSIQNVFVHLNGKLKLVLKPVADEELYVSRDRAPEFKKWLGQ